MTSGAMARMAKRRGEDWIYTTFSKGGRDTYEDDDFTANPSPPTIRGLRSDGGSRTVRDETGEERAVDIAVIVASPLKDANGNAVTIQDDMKERAATVTDSSGRIYKVAGVGHEAENPVGGLRLLCLRQVG